MDKNLLQEEFEQAEKRGGAEYAKAYTEGLNDGYQQALQQCHVMRWMAFENMQPEYMQCCLITNQWGQVTEAQYTGEANIFTIGEERYEAKAWMELPPPFA